VAGSLDGKVCVVTGANGAMGTVVTEELARSGATVVMLCRSREAGEAARDKIVAAGGARIEVLGVDLASQEQVRRAAAEIVAQHPRVHVLVNNAGVFLAHRQETEDGVEKTLATNYLSHFLLSNLLLDSLKAAAPSRVVTVASRTGRATVDVDDLMLTRKYSAVAATSQSKLAEVMFTLELARRLEGTGVTANALHPGLVKSTLTKELPAAMRGFLYFVSRAPAHGARTTVFLATSPEVESVSGTFFGPNRKPLKLPAQARDDGLRRRLWTVSARLTGLEPSAA
jgi:NAD(P)-dependent dehydrogenase (short-subunit alcohol dehydrogenase family)